MSDLAAYERRLSAALDRIARSLEARGAETRAARPPVDPVGDSALVTLREALEKERAANAQLSERVHQVKQRQDTTIAQLERRLARLTEQLDLQSLEMLRLKKANARLIDANTALRDAQAAAFPDATLVNKSISAELEALQAERRAEMAEMEEILAELKPLLAADARGA
jgi:small-conductance mechanosensitive channel